MKKRITITEGQLRNIIKRCINESPVGEYKLPGDETITDDDVVGIDGYWKKGLRRGLDAIKNQLLIISEYYDFNSIDGIHEIKVTLNRVAKDIDNICDNWLPIDQTR